MTRARWAFVIEEQYLQFPLVQILYSAARSFYHNQEVGKAEV